MKRGKKSLPKKKKTVKVEIKQRPSVKPPSHIKVGYQDFTFKIEPISYETSSCAGYTHKVNSLIHINTVGNKVEQANTIIHECLHAICYTQSIKLDDETEEQVVTSMANGLTALIRDNPKLVHYLLDQMEMI